MLIQDLLAQNGPHISFEFFPPKTEKASESLFHSIQELLPLQPAYVSVTYGAGGSRRDLTESLVLKLQRDTDLCIVCHITCVDQSKAEVLSSVQQFYDAGVRNFMCLRGDPPQGTNAFVKHPNGFEFAAELVGELKKQYSDIGIGVAGFVEGHPQTPNRLKEMEYLKQKVDAGADYICTQMFFDSRDFYDYTERCQVAGIEVPIIAGIMPITSRKGLDRMAELALGARFPARLLKALARAEDDEAVAKVGIHWATQQVMDLLEHGVAGIHFYTLNKSKPTIEVHQSLGVSSSNSLK